MDFKHLLELVGDRPVFETALLMVGNVNPNIVRQQISRWVKSGRLYQLRRELYVLAPPYRKVKPHPFLIANHMRRASYVSGQSALAFYGFLSEPLHATLSVTTARPERLETPLGVFEFRHIKPQLLSGYQLTNLGQQQALVALPEKALLDLVYLQPGGDDSDYLRKLRLQNLERLDIDRLHRQAKNFGTPKLRRAVETIVYLMRCEIHAYEML